MRRTLPIFVCVAAAALVAVKAYAVVVQIDGTVVPVDRAGDCPRETVRCCLAYYEDPDDAVDMIHDAKVYPGVFQIPCPAGCEPSECGVVAGCEYNSVSFEVLGEGAGFHNTFGWYNVGDDVTALVNLREILPCREGGIVQCPDTTPRTQVVDFQAEYAAGNYDGGFIGMWLRTPQVFDPTPAMDDVDGDGTDDDTDENGRDDDNCGARADFGNQIYFTEQELNDDGDFVHYLVWESATLDETFYFGFEDLFRGGDNDFEDMFFVARGLVPPCDPLPEICDGVDNDCDGEIDEDDPMLGEDCPGYDSWCAPPSYDCVSGALECVGGDPGTSEICNALDDDCDGDVDEGLSRGCTSICGAGTEICVFGAWTDCDAPLPTAEICDGADNDCDPSTPDGADEAWLGSDCGESRGACEPGHLECVSGGPVCVDATPGTAEICNGIDDDCDGETDEGNPGGGGLCGTDEGECREGRYQCIAGALECVGGQGPVPESCNGLDDDCDGGIDEDNPGGGAVCGTDVGACELGELTCVDGHYECAGGVGPTEEDCNNIDDDCDGVIDEGLVRDCDAPCGPGNQICVEGAWGPCLGPSGNPEICNGIDDDCDGEIDEGFEFLCPDEDAVCVEGECALPCAPGEFPCPPGKVCEEGYCVSGPCRDVECEEGQICIEGECTDLCGDVQCSAGYVCQSGRCVEDNCYGLGCPTGQICSSGECVDNPCAAVDCPAGEFCREGDCVSTCAGVRCPAGQVCHDGGCVEDDCAGMTCSAGRVCIDGSCQDDPCEGIRCGAARVCVDGECVDDPCLHVTCAAGERCIMGDCFDENPIPPEPVHQWGLATGAGGLACSASPSGAGAPTWLLLLGVLAVVSGLRRRRRMSRAGLFGLGAILVLALASSGCAKDPYCFTCEDVDGAATDGDADSDADSDADGNPDGCMYEGPEECDGRDNDCDGLIDEDFDVNSDPANCGDCGAACVVPHAFPACRDGECGIERCDVGWVDLDLIPGNGCEYECLGSGSEVCDLVDNDCDGAVDEGFDFEVDENNCGFCGNACAYYRGDADCVGGVCVLGDCEPGFVDLDGDEANGCEYNCTAAESETCDGLDNDCDGEVDEGFDLLTDVDNCGACGRICTFLNATALCGGGDCVLGPCDDGAIDLDGVPESGCEYVCTPTGAETCNRRDDDCDGLTDEEDPTVGTPCGTDTGECSRGAWACRAGDLVCEGDVEPTAEICDGEDNDCDGDVDDGNPGGGARCGDTNVGICEYGTITCVGGSLVCAGALVEPEASETCDGEDDDCDGAVDEGVAPRACSTRCGSGVERCSAGAWIDCDAPPELLELCNGVDDDCDGATDTGCPSLGPTDLAVEGSAGHTVFPSVASDGAVHTVVGYLERPGLAEVRLAGWDDSAGAWTLPPDTRMDWDDPGVSEDEDAMSPVVAMSGARAYLAWEEVRERSIGSMSLAYRNIYVRRSNDGGETWASGEVRVDVGQDTDSFSVAIAAFGSDVYVVWENMDTDRARHVYLAASGDGGASFAAPVRVDNNSASGVQVASEPVVAAGAAGNVYVAWRDNRHGPGAIYTNSSDDGGSTWLASDVRLDPSALEAESGGPVIASDGSGYVVVAWEDELPAGLDILWKIYGAVSEDHGATFSAAARLDDDPLPHDSVAPHVAVDPTGTAGHVVWRDMRNGLPDVYCRTVDLATSSWSATALRVDGETTGPGMAASLAPRVAAGSGGQVWVVWEDERDGLRDIFLNYSLNDGDDFQPMDWRLDTGAAGTADSLAPQVVATSFGALVVWVDYRNGAGTSGDLYSRTVLLP